MAQTIESGVVFAAICSLYSEMFDIKSISILWCEYFVIPNYKGEKHKFILTRKAIPRYINSNKKVVIL